MVMLSLCTAFVLCPMSVFFVLLMPARTQMHAYCPFRVLLDVHLCHKLPIQSIKSMKACTAFHDTLSGCQLFMKGSMY